MKILKHLAIVALVCYGASAIAIAKSPEVSDAERDMAQAKSALSAAKTDQEIVAAKERIEEARKWLASLVWPTSNPAIEAARDEIDEARRVLLVAKTSDEIAAAQARVDAARKQLKTLVSNSPMVNPPSTSQSPVIQPTAQSAPENKSLTKNQQLNAQVQKLEDELEAMIAKKNRGEISKEELKKYIDENSEAKRQLWSQQTIEIN